MLEIVFSNFAKVKRVYISQSVRKCTNMIYHIAPRFHWRLIPLHGNGRGVDSFPIFPKTRSSNPTRKLLTLVPDWTNAGTITLSIWKFLSKSNDGQIRHASWVCIGYTPA